METVVVAELMLVSTFMKKKKSNLKFYVEDQIIRLRN